MIKETTKKLLDNQNLSADESKEVMGQIMSGQTAPVQVAAYLTALRQKGETSEEILGSARAMKERVRRVRHHQEILFDNCGTGGDGAGTFNISTTAAFVLAACGLPMGKHGNRSVSSRCGSADLLEALGANVSLGPDQMSRCIDEVGLGFLYAPALHPAMKEVAPVRRQLGFRTIFNILGPLTNPAFATHQLIGVFDGDYTERMAAASNSLGVKKTCVVFNGQQIDELTTAGINHACSAFDGRLESFVLRPEDYGFKKCTVADLAGGTAEDNARITMAVLKGEKSPRSDTVVLNVAMGLIVADKVENMETGIDVARESIDSGKALAKLEDFVRLTNDLTDA